MRDNDDQPAFPVVADFGKDDRQCSEGITKREYFAAMALSGWLADPNRMTVQEAVSLSISAADLLLEELEK